MKNMEDNRVFTQAVFQSIIHEFSGSVRAIKSLSAWISEDLSGINIPPSIKEHLELITKKMNEMYYLVESIKIFSSACFTKEKIQSVDIGAVISEILENLPGKPDIVFEHGKELPVVHVEPMKIRNVFHQLIENSIIYNLSKPFRIKLEANEKKSLWQFELCDNGIGIESRFLNQVFLPFRSFPVIDGVNNRRGLGLAIVKQILEIWGCSIRVVSEPFHGSCFIFQIPKHLGRSRR